MTGEHRPTLQRTVAGPPPAHVPGRDRYLDLLRAAALFRVVAYHTFTGVGWLSIAFPAMGVMFALAGSLMARSLARPAGPVLRSRARRLLLPLWVFAAVVLGVVLWQGWRPATAGGWWSLLLWFVPVGDAPAPASAGGPGPMDPAWALQSADLLWYIRTYFWLMLLSPLLLRAFRRWPWPTLLAPLVPAVLLGVGVVTLPAPFDSPVTDLVTFAACWLLGFAHHDGLLARIPLRRVLLGGGALMAAGLAWAWLHVAENGWDLYLTPLAQALWSLGACVLLLRVSPSWAVLPRPLRYLDPAVTLINNRAVTIYLWHNVLAALTVPLTDLLWGVPALERSVPWLLDSAWLQLVLVWVLLAGVIIAVGWVEDVAARRPPRLWPTGRARPRATLAA
ncbi:acyltransferase family protein [Puerhibacterium sp. TATVAM-FAB25]|uniref:acyltransferase family protein n=1 Tax=Puerhibacterium sp. TATVAM-FAB25 TaxID=3093699 RepID=UPI00397CDD34